MTNIGDWKSLAIILPNSVRLMVMVMKWLVGMI